MTDVRTDIFHLPPRRHMHALLTQGSHISLGGSQGAAQQAGQIFVRQQSPLLVGLFAQTHDPLLPQGGHSLAKGNQIIGSVQSQHDRYSFTFVYLATCRTPLTYSQILRLSHRLGQGRVTFYIVSHLC